jgi:hypothetical protein
VATVFAVTRERRRTLIIGIVAIAAAVAFLLLAVNTDFYAPGAYHIQQTLANADGGRNSFLSSYQLGNVIYFTLRKSYSVVAFAILGFLTAPLWPRVKRVRASGLVVAGFSAVIEIVQKVLGSDEVIASNLFDIACGLAGGLIGAVLWNALVDRKKRA